MLISFSGMCGVGKTTMIDMLCDYLNTKRIPTIRKDIFHTEVPQPQILLRTSRFLKQNGISQCDDKEYKEILYAMGIVLSFEKNMDETMRETSVVICDRYLDNFIHEDIKSEYAKQVLGMMPNCDIRFYLTCEEELATKRVHSRGREMQEDWEEAQIKCSHYHENIIRRDPGYYKIIDANGSKEETFAQIVNCVEAYLKEHFLKVRSGE